MSSDTPGKNRLPDVTDQVVATYSQIGTINHLGHSPLPHNDAVIEITHDLMEVIYPGYQRRQKLHAGNVAYHVGDLLEGLSNALTQQVARALRHKQALANSDDPQSADANDAFEELAKQKTIALLESLPRLRELLATDVQAAYDGDPAAQGLDEIILCYPGLQAITVHRLAHELYGLDVPFIPRMMAEWSHNRTGIDIHPGAKIGPSFFIDHGTGVVIGETTEIAAHVKLYQGVTLGALSFPKDDSGQLVRGQKRHPTIEEGVVIYANATVLGGETVIGARSVIGASVSLIQSVPPNTVVTIEKPQLKFREAST
ncbi:MAG: serine acetyltransferase [Planctomycetaceae bacterium]|nr:serine acetyltransferase [Planctomycetaceae bacterium]|tara:strand:- start:253 stop:1194 length:942 start_codon:yes stop_codon:yes gene_type:complete